MLQNHHPRLKLIRQWPMAQRLPRMRYRIGLMNLRGQHRQQNRIAPRGIKPQPWRPRALSMFVASSSPSLPSAWSA